MFRLHDNQVIGSTKTVECKSNEYLDSCQSISNNTLVNSKSTEEVKSKPVPVGLPCRKKNNIQKQCIQEVKALHDQLYVITDKDVLTETHKKIREFCNYTKRMGLC